MALTDIDRQLLRRCLDEEPGAWKDFVDRFVGLFVHVVHHVAHARSVPIRSEDVDDLCAEIFLALLANNSAALRQFHGKSSLATYLTVVARRVVVREIARRRMAEALGHVGAHGANAERPDSAVAPQERVDDHDQVRRMLEELPDRDAEVVRQYHLEGRSYREISARLGIPENTIGPTLTRARERLRQRNATA